MSCSQIQSATASAPSGAQREAIPLPALPQTRFLRPVPSRGRPSFFPVFSHHAARTFLFGATSIGKPQLSRPRNGRSRKRPLPFRGDPSFARPQVPHARQGYLQRKPIKKGLWRHHRPFIIFRSYGSGYCPNAFSRASSTHSGTVLTANLKTSCPFICRYPPFGQESTSHFSPLLPTD